MRRKSTVLDLLINAIVKLNPKSGERANVMAFIHSCYCGRVTRYDFDAALASLAKLTDEEHHALIAWTVLKSDIAEQCDVGTKT